MSEARFWGLAHTEKRFPCHFERRPKSELFTARDLDALYFDREEFGSFFEWLCPGHMDPSFPPGGGRPCGHGSLMPWSAGTAGTGTEMGRTFFRVPPMRREEDGHPGPLPAKFLTGGKQAARVGKGD
jgi:hypothetical protein